MSTEPNNDSLEGEAWYDAEISPVLDALARRCHAKGMSFVASVEYEHGSTGDTMFLHEDCHLAMDMRFLLVKTAPNVDRYVMSLRKHCKEHGIDISGSFVLAGKAL